MYRSVKHLDTSLDKLAQEATRISDSYNPLGSKIILGEGSVKDSIRKRPRKKMITQKLNLALIEVAKNKGDTKMEKRYRNTWYCQSHITTHNGKAYGNYCKNRFCLVCLGIRKADMINRYYPIIEKWKQPHFLTLTVKAQPNQNLQKWMDGMKKALTKILKRCQKRFERNRGPKLIGVYSLECNFNPIRKTYNPHFHILTANKEIANRIKEEWLQIWTPKYALPYLQKIRKVKDTGKDLVETIKYGAKIFIDPTMKKKKGMKSKTPHKIYAAGLHEIYKAMDNKRLFGSFGFRLPKEEPKVKKEKIVFDFQEWNYVPEIADYVNNETGQLMTSFIPDQSLETILNEIDTSSS